MLKALAYGLPALTLIFTSWLPAGLQLSFFVSGLASAGQATAFRSNAVRERLGMVPLPSTSGSNIFEATAKTEEPRLRKDILTLDDLKAKYEAPKVEAQSGIKAWREKAVSGIRDGMQSAEKSMKEMTGGSAPAGKRTKAEKAKAEEYEKKRAREEAERRAELSRRQKEERLRRRAERGQ
jgi:YidC/Oxa1 family membrane protein insertase